MNAGLFLGMSLALSAPALKGPPKVDPRLVGTWVLDRAFHNGREATDVNGGLRYTFARDGRWAWHNPGGGRAAGSAVAPGPGPAPAPIDLTVDPQERKPRIVLPPDAFPPRSATTLGVYRVDGDTLTLCLAVRDGDRPTDLRPDQKGVIVLILTRTRPGD